MRRVGTGKSDCGISSPGDFDVFQKQHIACNHITIRLRGYAGNLQEFFRERLDFAKSKGILKKQIVLDPEMVFFSGATKFSFVVLRRISELHEFDLPLLPGTSRKYFLAGVSKGGILNFTERDIKGVAVSSKGSGKAFHFFVFMQSSRDVSRLIQ